MFLFSSLLFLKDEEKHHACSPWQLYPMARCTKKCNVKHKKNSSKVRTTLHSTPLTNMRQTLLTSCNHCICQCFIHYSHTFVHFPWVAWGHFPPMLVANYIHSCLQILCGAKWEACDCLTINQTLYFIFRRIIISFELQPRDKNEYCMSVLFE